MPPQNSYPEWRLLFILMAMNVVAYLDRSILSLAAPAVRADLGLSHVQISMLLGFGFIIFFVVLGIPLGYLIDRGPRRLIVAICVFFWSLSASSAGLAKGFWSLFAARIGVGAGEAGLNPAAYSMLTDAVPKSRLTRAHALYGSSSGLGAALSIGVGGILLGAATNHGPFDIPLLGTLQPWQIVLLLSGVPGLILAPIIFCVPEPVRGGQGETISETSHPSTTFIETLKEHWQFYSAAIIGFSTSLIFAYGFAAWQPTYMVEHFGWEISSVGLVLSIGMVGAFVGAYPCGWAVDKLIKRGVVEAPLKWASGVCVFSSICISMAFIVNDATLCILLVILGQLPIGLIGIVSSALQRVTPALFRGQITALFLLCTNLIGFGLGPFLPAALTDYVFKDEAALGVSVAIVTFVSGLVAAAILWSGSRPMRSALLRE